MSAFFFFSLSFLDQRRTISVYRITGKFLDLEVYTRVDMPSNFEWRYYKLKSSVTPESEFRRGSGTIKQSRGLP